MNLNFKIKVFVMYDGQCCTWNVMTAEHQCLFFGTADEADTWLLENNERYLECPESEVMEQVHNKLEMINEC